MNKYNLPYDEIITLSRRIHPKQIKLRRHLHQYPETSFNEFQTTLFIKKEIKNLGLKILPLRMETGVLAELKGKGAGPTVAIRTDIGALPIAEKTSLRYWERRWFLIRCDHRLMELSGLSSSPPKRCRLVEPDR